MGVTVPTPEELKTEAIRLRIDKRRTYREIAAELGISLGKVSDLLKDTPLPILKKDETGPETGGTEKRLPLQSVHHLISEVRMSKLFALALDEGYEDPNTWVDRVLLPWYEVKRHFEWMLKQKVNPVEFGTYLETCMLDSIELRDLKERLTKMTTATAPPTQQQPPPALLSPAAGGKT